MVTNWSDRLEKHQTIEILLVGIFFAMLHFSKIFEILKLISSSW